jgi:NTP pyrophosphatase (non-canonical NTP hydrolase)
MEKQSELNSVIKMTSQIIDAQTSLSDDDCSVSSHRCAYNRLISDVVDWADERGLLKEENSDKQLLKVVEEVGELVSAVLKKNRKEEVDAVGDIMVTLIVFAEIRGYDVMSSLGYAYQEIKDRTGKIVDGSFIKD